jgi:hypothetical protein
VYSIPFVVVFLSLIPNLGEMYSIPFVVVFLSLIPDLGEMYSIPFVVVFTWAGLTVYKLPLR